MSDISLSPMPRRSSAIAAALALGLAAWSCGGASENSGALRPPQLTPAPPPLVAEPPAPVETGRICVAGAAAQPRPGGSDCHTACLPDEELNAAGCCVRVSAPAAPTDPTVGCPEGQSKTVDTAGHCCWAGQVWSNNCCIGRPTSCPDLFTQTADGCVLPACPSDLVRSNDGLHCCWPGQAWSRQQGLCVGAPSCPAGRVTYAVETVEMCAPPPASIVNDFAVFRHDASNTLRCPKGPTYSVFDDDTRTTRTRPTPTWISWLGQGCSRVGESFACVRRAVRDLLPRNCTANGDYICCE